MEIEFIFNRSAIDFSMRLLISKVSAFIFVPWDVHYADDNSTLRWGTSVWSPHVALCHHGSFWWVLCDIDRSNRLWSLWFSWSWPSHWHPPWSLLSSNDCRPPSSWHHLWQGLVYMEGYVPQSQMLFQLGSYVPAFIAAGVPPIAGSILMLAIRCFPHKEEGKINVSSFVTFYNFFRRRRFVSSWVEGY